jgi:tellurite resistance protein TerC
VWSFSKPFIKTVQQARRLIKIVIGFTVVLFGIIMLVTPGPGLVVIVVGLAILGTEFVWARKLMKRFEQGARDAKNSLFRKIINKTGKGGKH